MAQAFTGMAAAPFSDFAMYLIPSSSDYPSIIQGFGALGCRGFGVLGLWGLD